MWTYLFYRSKLLRAGRMCRDRDLHLEEIAEGWTKGKPSRRVTVSNGRGSFTIGGQNATKGKEGQALRG